MKFTNAVTTFFALFILPLLSSMSLLVSGFPLQVAKRDVWDPRIIEPTNATVWKSGEIREVIWDTTDKPAEVTNSIGMVVFAFENIESPFILAHGFNLTDGRVSVKVPEVFTRPDYSIVLFGDSGNFSPKFTIQGVDE